MDTGSSIIHKILGWNRFFKKTLVNDFKGGNEVAWRDMECSGRGQLEELAPKASRNWNFNQISEEQWFLPFFLKSVNKVSFLLSGARISTYTTLYHLSPCQKLFHQLMSFSSKFLTALYILALFPECMNMPKSAASKNPSFSRKYVQNC